jgi:hypothetical protein
VGAPDRLDVARLYALVGDHVGGAAAGEVFAHLAQRLEDGTESEAGIAMMSKLRMAPTGDRPHRGQDMRIDATHVDKRQQDSVLTLSCPDCVGFKHGGPRLVRRRIRLDTLEDVARAALTRDADAFYVMSDGRLLNGV